jgi:hypothetical protein
MFRGMIGAFLMTAAAVPATAGNIVTTSPPGHVSCCSDLVAYESWTQSVTYTGVTITANLWDRSALAAATGTAYLMTQVGPGTTSANEFGGNAHFSINIGNLTTTPITLFSGLTLSPGTYFLVISQLQSSLVWDAGTTFPNSVVLGTGVTQAVNPFGAAAAEAPYAPASIFSLTQGNSAIFSVTGDLAASVPEPANTFVVLAALGSLVMALPRNRRQRAHAQTAKPASDRIS